MNDVGSNPLNVVTHDTPAITGFNRPDRTVPRSTPCVEIS